MHSARNGAALDTLTNRYSRRFTKIVSGSLRGGGLLVVSRQSGLALKSFTSVLIVACPCALALAAPFALGTAQRVLARRNVFLKNRRSSKRWRGGRHGLRQDGHADRGRGWFDCI